MLQKIITQNEINSRQNSLFLNKKQTSGLCKPDYRVWNAR